MNRTEQQFWMLHTNSSPQAPPNLYLCIPAAPSIHPSIASALR